MERQVCLCTVLLTLVGCGPVRGTYVEPPLAAGVEVTPGVARLTWRQGINGHATLIVRALQDAEAVAPDAALAVGDPLGRGVVVYQGEASAFADTRLPDSCGPFIWHLWAQAVDGSWAKTAVTVRSLRGAHTLVPTATVSEMRATLEGSQVRLQWQVPEASTGFGLVRVVRRPGAAPRDADDGVKVYEGPSSTFAEPLSHLPLGAESLYGIFNCNSCGRCGPMGASVSIPVGSDGGTTLTQLEVTQLSAQLSSDGRQVQLGWSSSAPRVRVLRTLNAAPTGPFDTSAVVVFDGAGVHAAEGAASLSPDNPLEPHRYTYTAWGCSEAVCGVAATVPFSLSLRHALRAGGYTLFMRHAAAGTCADSTQLGTASTTAVPQWWRSCDDSCSTATAAQLTPALADAETTLIRDFLTHEAIAVSRMVSSEFCRCVQTAERLQLGLTVERVPALTLYVYDDANRCRDTMSMLNAAPTAGTVALYVGHAEYPSPCPILGSLDPGEVAIFKPSLGAPPQYVGRVKPSDWASLP